jgi:hypothetical protein
MSKTVTIKTKKRLLVERTSDGEIVATGIETTRIKTVWYDRCRPHNSENVLYLCEAVTHIN